MIDIHTHVLPGIDDGAQDLVETFEILKVLSQQGVTTLIATPHIISGVYENTRSIIDKKIQKVQNLIDESKLNLTIYAGAELYSEPDIITKTEKEKLTLGDSNYILIETSLQRFPDNFDEILFHFQQKGYRPIIAHAERFLPFINNIDYLLTIVNREIFIQMNSGSLLGIYGKTVKELALEMLKIGCVHVIASDVHGLKKRPILMKEAYEYIAANLSRDIAGLLFYENPKRILNNKPLISIHDGYYEESTPKTNILSTLKKVFKH